MLSSVSLAFNSGSFVINLKNVGFSILSSIEKGVSFCVNGVTNTVNSVGELRKLKKEYDELVIKLEKFEQMQRSNVDIRKENERLAVLRDSLLPKLMSGEIDVSNISV